MAGGIDWFRWHHGSVTDPKFQLVAKKSGARLGDVLAVWAYLLEMASAAPERGRHGPIDAEAMDCMLDMADGASAAILAAMVARNLTDGERIANWDKRQPKREDETAAERKRRQRERDHEVELAAQASVTAGMSRDVTLSHADVTHGHDRGEKSREEEYISKPTASHPLKRAKTPTVPCPVGQIVALYHSALPDLPSAKLMPPAREKAIRKVWAWVLSSKRSDGQPRATNADEALAWLASYFGRAAQNDFLMGRIPRVPGHENWRCDLDFLLTDKGMKQVIEKTADRDAA